MSAKFVSQKVSKIRWKPQTRSFLENDSFISGSSDEKVNSVDTWKVSAGLDEKADFVKQSSLDVKGDVTELQWLTETIVCVTTSSGSAVLLGVDGRLNAKELMSWKGLHHVGSVNLPCTGFAALVNHLVTIGEDSRICVLQDGSASPVREILSADFSAMTCAVAAGESALLTGNSRGLMKIWDIRTEGDKAVESFVLTDQGEISATCVGRHPSQSHVVIVGQRDGAISVWDLRKVESPVSVLMGHDSAVNELHFHEFSPNHIVTCSEGGDLWHWDVSAAAERHAGVPFQEHEMTPWLRVSGGSELFSVQELLPNINLGINSLSLSGNRVLCGTDDEAVYLVDNVRVYGVEAGIL